MIEKMNSIIKAAKIEAQGKSTYERFDIYDKYKYKIYELTELGEQQPYIKQLIDALNI